MYRMHELSNDSFLQEITMFQIIFVVENNVEKQEKRRNVHLLKSSHSLKVLREVTDLASSLREMENVRFDIGLVM